MQPVHLGAVDLNLLAALDALLSENSVSRAAARLGLSQSVMSHTLGRLRELFGDPLFTRTARGLIPTERAEALRPPLRRALGEIERTLRIPHPFEPATASRTFTLIATDYAEVVLLPTLLRRLSRAAPAVNLVVLPFGDQLERSLDSDTVDLALPVWFEVRPQLRSQPLFKERFVSLVRRAHPVVQGTVSLTQYAALDHLLVAPRGRSGSFVEEILRRHGLSRRIALTVPHFLAAAMLVAESDLIVTLASRIAHRFAELLPLQIIALPFELEGFTVSQLWHERNQDDRGHAWLRQQLLEAGTELEQP